MPTVDDSGASGRGFGLATGLLHRAGTSPVPPGAAIAMAGVRILTGAV